MNIKDLKEAIKDLPEDMKVGGSGHYGEFLTVLSAKVETMSFNFSGSVTEDVFCIDIEDRGEEPD